MAKSVKALITPEVLKWARKRRINLGINYAAKRLKIDPERLEAWENGADRPTFTQLKKIAKLYRTHISIFYLPEPPTDFQVLTDYRVLPQRESATEEQQIYRLNVNIIEAFERRETLIELYESLDASSLIEAYHSYPMELFPSLWNELEKLIKSDRLKMPELVFDEVKDEEIQKWCAEK